jgi:hypothetical protein
MPKTERGKVKMDKLRIVFGMMVVALMVGVLGATPARVAADVKAESGVDLDRSAAADTARWVAMGEYYTKLAETQQEWAAEADAARWTAKGEFFKDLYAQDGFDLEQGAAADSARWAMGEFYTTLAGKTRQRATEADAAR